MRPDPEGERRDRDRGHARVVTSAADSAGGDAALTLMPAGVAVLSVGLKVNLMKPAVGSSCGATGKVITAGCTISVCNGKVHALREDKETIIAAKQATMMTVRDRDALTG